MPRRRTETAPTVLPPRGADAPADRQQRRFAERDRRIREAAQRLLLERGLHGFSMDDVAEAIDYSKGTVYQHYVNKEDALVASCVDSCGELAGWFERAAATPGTPRDRMTALAEAYCRFAREKPIHFRVIPMVHSPTVFEKVSPERRAAMEATRGRCVAACGGVVRAALERGDLALPRGMPPEYVTIGFWALMFGAFMLAELHRPEGLLGIEDPTEAILASWKAQMDGLGWRSGGRRAASRRGAPSRRSGHARG
jgi:AcrR family transcriptional regulator